MGKRCMIDFEGREKVIALVRIIFKPSDCQGVNICSLKLWLRSGKSRLFRIGGLKVMVGIRTLSSIVKTTG